MWFGDFSHHALNMLGFTDPQAEIHSQRLSWQTVERNTLPDRIQYRPQLWHPHDLSEIWPINV